MKMSRVSSDIRKIQEKFKEADIPMGETVRPTKSMMYQFLKLYSNVDDSRSQGMISYPLAEIILAAFLAVLGGADDWVEIAGFCQTHQRWLIILSVEHAFPRHIPPRIRAD